MILLLFTGESALTCLGERGSGFLGQKIRECFFYE
jgi:hypothetical protein